MATSPLNKKLLLSKLSHETVPTTSDTIITSAVLEKLNTQVPGTMESTVLSSPPPSIAAEDKPVIPGSDITIADESTIHSARPPSVLTADETDQGLPQELVNATSSTVNLEKGREQDGCHELMHSPEKPTSEEPAQASAVLSEHPKSPIHTIVCREWKTECPPALQKLRPNVDVPPGTVPVVSCIPEKDAVLWQIKDFTAFRAAAQASQLPPLISPDFGGGCHLRLALFDKKAHVSGCVEIPLVKATRDGVIHVKIFVVRPDLKVILTRKVEMRIAVAGTDNTKALKRTSQSFRLSQKRTCRSPRVQHLIVDDQLRLRIELQYFPFDAPVFRGLTSVETTTQFYNDIDFNHCTAGKSSHVHDEQRRADLLHDIRSYCQEDPTQNVEVRRDDVIFHSCRFLLCARSRRFREIFAGKTYTASGRGSPSRFLPSSRVPAGASALTSVTLRDIPADVLDEMLSFIHTDTCSWLEDYNTDILKTLELFEAADLYSVDALTTRLTYHLTQRMNIDNYVYMFEVSERCKNETFKRICAQFLDSIPGSQVATLMRATSLGQTPREAGGLSRL